MVRHNSPIRGRGTDRNTDDTPDRGQVILIGAIALAFIILGVVIVFNGVLYTETLSSADTSQSAATAEKTELEIEQGIGCLIAEGNDAELFDSESAVNEEIESFNEVYQNATAHSQPVAVNIDVVETDFDPSNLLVDDVTVTITYDSTELSYEQERTITADDCPGES